jgi:hypothetical protein
MLPQLTLDALRRPLPASSPAPYHLPTRARCPVPRWVVTDLSPHSSRWTRDFFYCHNTTLNVHSSLTVTRVTNIDFQKRYIFCPIQMITKNTFVQHLSKQSIIFKRCVIFLPLLIFQCIDGFSLLRIEFMRNRRRWLPMLYTSHT